MTPLGECGVRIGIATGDLTLAARLDATTSVDSLWVGGHIASRNPSGEAMVSLARLSAVTTRVRLGTSILLLGLYPPAIVAKQVADLDRASGGRLTLGVGIGGEYPQEFRACQVPRRDRAGRTDEAIPLLRRMWTGERFSHEGPFFSMEDICIHPPPHQEGGPPIVVAGRKPAAMRRAALLGDGWMPYLYSPRRYAESVSTIQALAAGARRDLTGFEWFAYVFVTIDADPARARHDAAQALGGLYNQNLGAMIDSIAVAGTPDDVVAGLRAFVDAGAQHLILLPTTSVRSTTPEERAADRDAVVEKLLDKVIPEVRSHTASPGEN